MSEIELKRCGTCGQTKPLVEFTLCKGSKTGYGNRCRECTNQYSRMWKRANPNKRYTTQQRYYYTARGYYTKLKFAAKRRGNPFNIHFRSFADWLNTQNDQCHYCKKQLSRNGGYSEANITIDRLDNSRGYQLNNIVLCCRRCNTIKGNWFSEQQMLQIAKAYLRGQNYELAIVDRGAVLPFISLESAAEHDASEPWCAGNFVDSLQAFAGKAQQDMLKAGYVKEIKD